MGRRELTAGGPPSGWIAAALAATMISLCSTEALAKKPELPHEYGPEPDWETFKKLAEDEVRNRLRDPDSARFRWDRGYIKGGWGLWSKGRTYGYTACGYYNAANRYGGYSGYSAFVVVIDNGEVLGLDIDERVGGLAEQGCRRERGSFPPIPITEADQAPDNAAPVPPIAKAPAVPTSAPFGLTLSGVPDGAYVASVAPGSLAAQAGVKPGMVIDHIDSFAIAGMAVSLVSQLLSIARGKAVLTMIGGSSFTLQNTPIAPAPAKAGAQ